MTELNVQPKKKNSLLSWLVLLLVLIALVWFLSLDKNDDRNTTTAIATDTTNNEVAGEPNTSATQATGDWGTIDFSSPELKYDEITKNISVRGNDSYGIYEMDEMVLFDKGKATIRPDAEANLKEVVSSIDRHYKGGGVRVYGYTDSVGGAEANKELARQRADAVKGWLQNNGIDGSRISVNAIGEGQPVASNSTNEGRRQNRRVEIVARSNAAQ